MGQVCVARDTRRRGLGSRLVKEAVGQAKEEGWDRILVMALESAVVFYKRQGFLEDDGGLNRRMGMCPMTMTLDTQKRNRM